MMEYSTYPSIYKKTINEIIAAPYVAAPLLPIRMFLNNSQ